MATYKLDKNGRYRQGGTLAKEADVPEQVKEALQTYSAVIVGQDGGLYSEDGEVLAENTPDGDTAETTTEAPAENEAAEDEITEDVQVTAGFSTKQVVKRYYQGANYYQLAQEFYGFQSDDAVDRIRHIVEAVTQPN